MKALKSIEKKVLAQTIEDKYINLSIQPIAATHTPKQHHNLIADKCINSEYFIVEVLVSLS